MMSDWQYRNYYGDGVGPAEAGWTDWRNLFEGVMYYGPRTLLEQDPNATGRIEFRKTPQLNPHCERCELAVEDLGLCFQHLNEELDLFNSEEDPWPDYDDELPGMWSQSDLIGGETDRFEVDHPAWERDEWDNYTGYGA
jgi:hypothetical protein